MPVELTPLYRNQLLYGMSLADIACMREEGIGMTTQALIRQHTFMISWPKTPPTMAHTGLSSELQYLEC